MSCVRRSTSRVEEDRIDALVARLQAALAEAKEGLPVTAYASLNAVVQVRRDAALAARHAMTQQAEAWKKAPSPSPTPAQPAALVRRVLSSPSLTNQELSPQPHRRSPPRDRPPPSLAGPPRLAHAASAVSLSAYTAHGRSGGGPARVLRRSASLATVLSLVEDDPERDAEAGSATTAPPRVVQYVRVSAAVAPASVVAQRFNAFLGQRQRRVGLTFTPPASLRDNATQIFVKPKGFSAKCAALDAQGWQCRGCRAPFSVRYGVPQRAFLFPSLDDASFCYYTGQFYCARCLPPYRGRVWRRRPEGARAGDTAVLPAHVLQQWDVAPHPVCTRASAHLAAIADTPLYCLSLLAPHLLSDTAPPILVAAHTLRRQVVALRDVGSHCPRFRALFYGTSVTASGEMGDNDPTSEGSETEAYIPRVRRYLVETVDWWSLADLAALHRCEDAARSASAESHFTSDSPIFAAASLSHSPAGLFEETTQDDSTPTAARPVALMRACPVWQALRRLRCDLLRHVANCSCCVCHSIDVCRLCMPGQWWGTGTSATTARKGRTDRQLPDRRRAVGDGVCRGAAEDPSLAFMRCLLQHVEGSRAVRQPLAEAAGSGAYALSPSGSSASLMRSTSARWADDPPAASGGAARSRQEGMCRSDRDKGKDDEWGCEEEEEDEEGQHSVRSLLASLPSELSEHLVYVYDTLHVCRCPRCGASYHLQCVARRLGTTVAALTQDSRCHEEGSAAWCILCRPHVAAANAV